MKKHIISIIIFICCGSIGVSCTFPPIENDIIENPAINTPIITDSIIEETIEEIPLENIIIIEEPKFGKLEIKSTKVEEPEVEEPQEPSETISVTDENREQIALMIARVMYRESRGIKSETEMACVAWTILNRVDAGYGNIYRVITMPYQFAYDEYAPTVSDYGYDLVTIAKDILLRWEREHAGEIEVGRVLPKDYLWYNGYSGHNWFRNVYDDLSNPWNYSLPSPYET